VQDDAQLHVTTASELLTTGSWRESSTSLASCIHGVPPAGPRTNGSGATRDTRDSYRSARGLDSDILKSMCRNIKTLFNFDPPVTPEEIRAASIQFVRKISGFNKPAKVNESSFLAAVDQIAEVSTRLLHALETNAPPKNREEEAAKAKVRSAERFGI
jgi:hypothetical protein